jgi:hypothetical protein
MAKFCSVECKETGSICDCCKHYQDEDRDIKKLKREDGTLAFAGGGICDIDGSETDACAGYNCDDFECTLSEG